LISVTTSCFNEEEVIEEFVLRVIRVLEEIGEPYELIISDNCSQDGTSNLLRQFASRNKSIKLIFNEKNFGPERSPVNAFYASSGDVAVMLASDLQDPPELIIEFFEEWVKGNKVVLARYITTEHDSFFLKNIRMLYYWLFRKISSDRLTPNCTGFGLYDRSVIETMRLCSDPFPFPRGLVVELGYQIKIVDFLKPKRFGGLSKRSIAAYYDLAVAGITLHSTFPLRFIAILGFAASSLSIAVGFVYLSLKLFNWESFEMGIAPAIIFTSFMFGVVLLLLGIVAEYIAVLIRYAKARPLVTEKERVNF
jgi:glycosyltransferase involved in cell wall biosynthesis